LRDARDLQLADSVPQDECVKNLFCDVEVLNPEAICQMRGGSRGKGAYGPRVLRKARLRRRNLSTGIGLSIDEGKLDEGVTDSFEEETRLECPAQRIAAQRRIKLHSRCFGAQPKVAVTEFILPLKHAYARRSLIPVSLQARISTNSIPGDGWPPLSAQCSTSRLLSFSHPFLLPFSVFFTSSFLWSTLPFG
jgi:hypothetical protein